MKNLAKTKSSKRISARKKPLLRKNKKFKGVIDFSELKGDGEKWELFARDFLIELGFVIESSPDRGADNGKDMIVQETIKGKISTSQFRWLVSCKNFVKSDRSVRLTDEQNILDRCNCFSADGFIGFYSTVPSSGLQTLLSNLKQNGKLKGYTIFDHELIENYLLAYKCSRLILRYFPESYKKMRPLHRIFDDYIDLKCEHCKKDLLPQLYYEKYDGMVVWIYDIENGVTIYKDCYVVHKNKCDKQLKMLVEKQGYGLEWTELSDLARPNFYLQHVLEVMEQLRSSEYKYEDKVLNKEKLILKALAQKVFHEVTEEDRSHFNTLMQI